MAGLSQDWEPVVIRKKAPTAAARKDEKAVNAARRAGAEIETVRKVMYSIILHWSAMSVCTVFILLFPKRRNKRLLPLMGFGPRFQGCSSRFSALNYTFGATTAGSNKAASSSTTLNTRKLDEDTENLSHQKVPTELKKAIMQARQDKKLTQSQLAQLINEKPQIIQEYESGKAIPNQQIISKLERALGAKLRGKK
ncbi:hypothetical protein H5410_058893 [Solanum commersonii]|uniref:HTH cro/C1-type domain-containing protein n=1 Tax=Solanum commersonii TaxID=4109 RepID=A0A9J5W184_SOLCO|nr:hypothetical protein H5410_058893 [Solanum commersonii]